MTDPLNDLAIPEALDDCLSYADLKDQRDSLLAACKAIVEPIKDFELWPTPTEDVVQKCRAAIAKAEGRG